MISFLIFVLKSFLYFFRSDYSLYVENLLLKKEVEILKRNLSFHKTKVLLSKVDKIFFVHLNLLENIQNKVSLFSPYSLLKWQRTLTADFWTFFNSDTHPGRPPVPKYVKKLILSMKNNNLLWGAKRIRDELLKLGVSLHKKTVQNILLDFRKKGKIKKNYTWKNFLSSQIDSLFATDFFTVDTIFNQRFYVLFFISHKSREIVQFAIT